MCHEARDDLLGKVMFPRCSILPEHASTGSCQTEICLPCSLAVRCIDSSWTQKSKSIAACMVGFGWVKTLRVQ